MIDLHNLPWDDIRLIVVFLGMLALVWRAMGVADRALAREQGKYSLPPPLPVPQPAPPVVAPPKPAPVPVPAPVPPAPAPAPPVPVPVPVVVQPPVLTVAKKWPTDNQDALIAFYGDPARNEVEPQLIHIIPPFRMTEDGKAVPYLVFHKKAADALLAALTTVWDYYGHDQAKMDALGISKTAGTYNKRFIRGSSSKWSNHAYGAAIDINAEENGFNVAGNIPRPMIAAFKAQGARWGGDYSGRTDPMHFEFCESGEPRQSFEAWLAHYGVTKSIPTPGGSPAVGETVTGKVSWFGGPQDMGVKPDEGLALCEVAEVGKFPGLFLAVPPAGTTGLARRLDPASHFIAMRWDYKVTPRAWLQTHKVTVSANGKTFDVQPIDWGPNEHTGRIADLSKGLMDALGLNTDDTCSVTIPAT